jgi:uncharacterized protein (DUF433 family)
MARCGKLEFSSKYDTLYLHWKNLMTSNLSRITTNPDICGGRPCIRNMRIRVSDVLDLLAAGEPRTTILADYPYLENEDITAALEYASAASSHRVIAAE